MNYNSYNDYNNYMNKQAGQVVLILVLVMTVALAIGISVIQRSLSDISTSTSVEQSSRAFSAAEAGIEKALRGDYSPLVDFSADNNSRANVTQNLNPPLPAENTRQDPLEYPPLAKEETAHVWLADPNANLHTCSASDVCYKQPTIDVYWGDSAADQAALELTLVYYDGSKYVNRKWYLDDAATTRNPDNNFDVSADCSGNLKPLGFTATYQCKKTLGDSTCINRSGVSCSNNASLPTSGMMLIRTRLLYNNSSQPFAVQAVGNCGADCSIPPQANILVSTGTSGKAQRKIRLFQIDKVVPPYFDYAVFSAGAINK